MSINGETRLYFIKRTAACVLNVCSELEYLKVTFVLYFGEASVRSHTEKRTVIVKVTAFCLVSSVLCGMNKKFKRDIGCKYFLRCNIDHSDYSSMKTPIMSQSALGFPLNHLHTTCLTMFPH